MTSNIFTSKDIFAPAKQIVFIDSKVENYQEIAAGIVPGIETIILDSHSDGIEQITNILRDKPEKLTVHLISHGTAGCLHLGNIQLRIDTLSEYTRELRLWFAETSGEVSRNIVLYGCNVAVGNVGKKFVDQLRYYTGAEITASTTPTGNSELGGDWNLEYATSETKVPVAIAESVRAKLAGCFSSTFSQCSTRC